MSIMSDVAKNFDILAISFIVLYNYFDYLTKLFSDLLQNNIDVIISYSAM